MDRAEIEERIKRTAEATDVLITRLDTLINRIDTAKANQNQELVEYYERQFTEVSMEFMDGVESILDGWYSIRGETRPPADTEQLSPEDLDEIHNTVVSIVQGLSILPKTAVRAEETSPMSPVKQKTADPEHRVDVTG